MKRIQRLLVIICALTLSATAYAATGFTNPEGEAIIVEVNTIENRAVVLKLANLLQERTIVKIEDLEGQVFYEEVIKNHNGYHKKFNFSEMDSGRFLLKIQRDGEEMVQVIVLKENTLQISDMVPSAFDA